jgi:hypothetical protein
MLLGSMNLDIEFSYEEPISEDEHKHEDDSSGDLT